MGVDWHKAARAEARKNRRKKCQRQTERERERQGLSGQRANSSSPTHPTCTHNAQSHRPSNRQSAFPSIDGSTRRPLPLRKTGPGAVSLQWRGICRTLTLPVSPSRPYLDTRATQANIAFTLPRCSCCSSPPGARDASLVCYLSLPIGICSCLGRDGNPTPAAM